jgi:hypothetical protein
MSDIREVKNLLGMQIERLKDRSLFLHQSRYISDTIAKFSMADYKPVNTPMAARIIPSDSSFDQKEYQRITGSEMWPSLGCRFDITYATGYLGRFNSAPTSAHHSAQMRVLRYLQGTRNLGILYNSNSSEGLVGFIDADWGGDDTDRKSTTSYVLKLYGSIVSAASIKQKTVATSTLEAESITLAEAVKETLWLQRLLCELGLRQDSVTINIDNKGAIDYAKNAQFSQRTKHINIKHHFIRDHIEKGTIILAHVASGENIADILTKSLDKGRFEKLRDLIGMRQIGNQVSD